MPKKSYFKNGRIYCMFFFRMIGSLSWRLDPRFKRPGLHSQLQTKDCQIKVQRRNNCQTQERPRPNMWQVNRSLDVDLLDDWKFIDLFIISELFSLLVHLPSLPHNHKMSDKEELVQKAKLAEQAERWVPLFLTLIMGVSLSFIMYQANYASREVLLQRKMVVALVTNNAARSEVY